ncbi:glycogen/starch synthase [Chloroflexota bacterium]
MTILFIACEAFPLAKVGGLADVTSSLAIPLHESGH